MVASKNINKEIILTVKRFTRHLTTQGVPIQKAILFGSWAKGKAGRDSDIDLCLVSSKFGEDEIGELQFLLRESRKINDNLEPIPLSLRDYQEDTTPLVLEIKKYGVEL